MPQNILAIVINSSILVWLLWPGIDQRYLLTWFALVWLVLIYRFLTLLQFRRTSTTKRNCQAVYRLVLLDSVTPINLGNMAAFPGSVHLIGDDANVAQSLQKTAVKIRRAAASNSRAFTSASQCRLPTSSNACANRPTMTCRYRNQRRAEFGQTHFASVSSRPSGSIGLAM